MTHLIALCCLLALVVAPRSAEAYIDPGAGSLMLQGLLAVMAGGFLVLRRYWSKVLAVFRRDAAGDDDLDDTD